MERITRIELSKENFKFSSVRFTIFSASERENIHGHDFRVHVAFDVTIEEYSIIFDYALAKRFIETMCSGLNERFLVPENSNHLHIEKMMNYIWLHFNGEKIPFLARDVNMLPVEYSRVEDLSFYLLGEFVTQFVQRNFYKISYVEMKTYSGPGQSTAAHWKQQA